MTLFMDWVREIRQSQRMTQTECADRAGMKLQQWNQLEKQVKQPARATVEKVADALGVKRDAALAVAGYQTETSDIPPELATIWQSVPRERQAGFLRAVRSVADAVSL